MLFTPKSISRMPQLSSSADSRVSSFLKRCAVFVAFSDTEHFIKGHLGGYLLDNARNTGADKLVELLIIAGSCVVFLPHLTDTCFIALSGIGCGRSETNNLLVGCPYISIFPDKGMGCGVNTGKTRIPTEIGISTGANNLTDGNSVVPFSDRSDWNRPVCCNNRRWWK